MTVLLGLGALVLLVVGLAGYGAILLDAITEKRRSGFGLCAAVGLALALALCGLLELGRLASPAFFIAFLAAGAAIWIWRSRRTATRTGAQPALRNANWALLLPLAAGLVLIVNSADWRFTNPDDLQGYLVYIERILQTGGTGSDPFSYRRFEAGLGGGDYLYALGGAFSGPASWRVLDVGGGLVLLAATMAADLKRQSASVLAAALAMLVYAAAFTPSVNMTPEVMGMALVYATAELFRRLADGEHPWRRAGLVALMVFAATCLKTTLLVPAAGFAAALYAALFIRQPRRQVVAEALAAVLLTLLLMLPWMAVSERTAGTPLFPLFGAGRLSPLEAAGHPSPADFVKAAGRLALLFPLPLWVALGAVRRKDWFLAVALPLGIVLLVLAQTKFTVAGYRYGYSGAASLFLFSLVRWLDGHPSRREWIAAAAFAPLLLIDLALYPILTPGYKADTFSGGVLARAFTTHGGKAESDQEYRRVQDVIPAGAAILARIDRPYRLDFRRNRIFVLDWPGLTGPETPLPGADDVQGWSRYLGRAGVGYVMYSYKDQAGMPDAFLKGLIRQSDSAFLRRQLSQTLRVQRMLDAMRRSEPVIYDDGSVAVVRLRAKS